MELINRPKQVEKGDRNYLTNENFQDFVEQQFKIIYDKIDEIIRALNG